MTVYEGAIVTCDAAGSVQRFLAEDRGRIAYTGNVLPEAYARAPRVDLGKGALLPAFADTHIHFLSHALFSNGLDVRDARTIDEAVAKVASFAAARKDAILIGFGTSAHSVAERRLLRKSDLDRAAPDRPVFLVKYDGHAAVVNSQLLSLLPGAVSGLRGFDAESGLLTQEAFFGVTNIVTGKVSLGATLSSMLATLDAMAANGIGLVHSVSGVGFPLDMDVTLESLFARGLRNPLQYRLFFQTMDVRKVLKRRLPRVGGCFATALDGCFGSVDAALLQPYADDAANSGVLFYPDEKVRAFAREANRAGLQIEMHAIGDRAFEQAVQAITAALADFPRADHRHTIIHAFLPTARGLEACAKAGIAVAVQPAVLHWEQEPLFYLEKILGERARKLAPLESMRRLGIRLAGGSDAPCTPPDPLASVWAACNHYAEGESLSVQEALNLHTRNAAWICFDERERGSLEAGKIADLVVLDRNPLAVDKRKLREIKVEKLLLAGEPYRKGQGRLSVLLRGIAGRRKI
jgi:predicted amidohydrolase YtcJ